GDTVYAADLKGVVHGINLKGGSARWRLDLGKDPAVSSPGMVYGGPVVHAGRGDVATRNPAGGFVNKPTAVGWRRGKKGRRGHEARGRGAAGSVPRGDGDARRGRQEGGRGRGEQGEGGGHHPRQDRPAEDRGPALQGGLPDRGDRDVPLPEGGEGARDGGD